MNIEKVKLLQRKAKEAANFALLCLEMLDRSMPWEEHKERVEDAREYQRQAHFLAACARQEMGLA
ncbi:hypothetical protein G6L26_007550 [Agrobacterium radiobacter]|uniref:Uncharacterized protein n=2 Tax=Agrobacterium TaxID=357 RepID=A0A822UY37_AGRTU|nr:hypothetical protein [Agrobacterium tumefaciens]KWT88033.1 hypothetical protein ASB65_18550 [Agrobacterium tumefaciens str. B6]MQB28169.1 hypothetical protein [Agrobacterium tumefaciens]NTA05026.1 hypothetical protein [Agrobacterium tumefaciens]NTA91621.1 hypothetical protein [Agrobacterium tumefaciens]NTB12771.1 hypothetical protein [Agrobacterium tumefaciens]